MSIYNPFLFPLYTPFLPNDCDKPPTIYSLLESIVNFGTDDKQKISDLAKYGRKTFFNFEYPLSNNIKKEDFECMILNHFLMRRIGYDTLTAFRIQLNVKLNEIMPMYNKLFDALQNWNIFDDGEKIERITDYDGFSDSLNSQSRNSNTNTKNDLENISDTENTNTIDRRNSELPQSEIENVKNASYLTDYTYEEDKSKGKDISTSKGNSTTNTTENTDNTINTIDKNRTNETIKRTPSDKMKIYKEFLENRNNIYTMIFKDLECLFYQLV